MVIAPSDDVDVIDDAYDVKAVGALDFPFLDYCHCWKNDESISAIHHSLVNVVVGVSALDLNIETRILVKKFIN